MVLIEPARRSPDSVRSVERTLDLLVALERADGPVGLTELARSADIPKATAQRLLGVLERRGFVQKERRCYQLGAGIVPLAGAFLAGSSLAKAAMPILEELAALSGETISLQVRQGFDRVAVQRVHSPHSLGYLINIGQRLPLHLGASGKVLMAWMPEEDLRRFLEPLAMFYRAGGRTMTRDELQEELKQVRLQGFAVSLGEREMGVVSVAAPVLRHGGDAIAALSLTGPPIRMTQERMERLSVEIRRAAQEVARRYSRM